MPRSNRLTRADFNRIDPRKGVRVHGEFFSLAIVRSPGISAPKFAIVTSKKVSTKASVRNRIERWSREAVRPFLAKIQPGAYVLYAKSHASRALRDTIFKDIATLLTRTHA